MHKDDAKKVARIIAHKMAAPKRVVGAWKFDGETDLGKSAWEKISVFDLPGTSGVVCLAYDDGTITKCSVEKGVMQGGYIHYDKSSDGQSDPMHLGSMLERGRYRDGWRVGGWISHTKLVQKQMEDCGLSFSAMPFFEQHTEGWGKRDMMIGVLDKTPFVTTLCDLPAPVGLVKIGDRVEECLMLKQPIRFRDRSTEKSPQPEEKKKEKEKEKIPLLNVIRRPNQTRGR